MTLTIINTEIHTIGDTGKIETSSVSLQYDKVSKYQVVYGTDYGKQTVIYGKDKQLAYRYYNKTVKKYFNDIYKTFLI